ncbi:MAG: TerB family tellurite resistance protein [Nannocystaceae bacterium]
MLTAQGLIALADRVLTGAEATRVLSLVHQHLDVEEQDQWMDLLTDLDGLSAHFDGLATPEGPPEAILEELWSIALVDGDASMAEVRMLERIGQTLGVDAATVHEWRKAWTTEVIENGDFAARFLATLIGAGEGATPSEEDRAYFEKLVNGLPISLARRKKLLRFLERPPTVDALAQELAAVPEAKQAAAIETIERILERSIHASAGKAQLASLRQRMAKAAAAH